MDHLFDTRPERPGYRLHRLEIFNWGTFDSTDGQVYRFEPEGRTSLLVGQNGSGKSTLVDAVLTLLVEPRTRNYNVAAGAKKTERTEKSYIRGAYKRTSDDEDSTVVKYLRTKGTNLTALAAVFRDEHLDQAFTLCQVLYLKSDGTADKIFGIYDDVRELKTDLAGVCSSEAIRPQLQRLGYQTTRKFIEYHGWLIKRTSIRSKAMDMFNQTVAVKDIRSLNKFIREHMLEAHDWREKVSRLLNHFSDLSLAHQELVRAQLSEELLTPVEKRGKEYQKRSKELGESELRLLAADMFFCVETVSLFDPEIARYEEELVATLATKERLAAEIKDIAEKIRKLKNEIDLAGGDRLREIPALIKIEQAELKLKTTIFQQYHDQLKICGMHDTIETEAAFAAARLQLQLSTQLTAEQLVDATRNHEDSISDRGDVHRQLREEQNELEILSQRQTNLPAYLSILRSQICEDLQLSETALPFAAELISVDPDERRWEASAEMVLRSFALSLLVPDRFYRRVRSYVEHNLMADAHGKGQRLVYLRVGKGAEPSGDRIHPQSLIRKLRFRERHDLTPWVSGEVQRRFDFRCCESVDEFNETIRLAMTENRHIKTGNDRHEKDDRPRAVDPRYYVLGWDNREKKRRIAERIRELDQQLKSLENTIETHSRRLDELKQKKAAAAGALKLREFDAIHVEQHQDEILALKREESELKSANKTMKVLEERLKAAESDEELHQKTLGEMHEKKALLEIRIQDGKRLRENARNSIRETKKTGQYDLHASMFASIRETLGEPLSSDDLFQRKDSWKKDMAESIGRLRHALQPLIDKLLEAMSRFLREFKEEQADLSATEHALDSFLGLLERIRREDLPRYEKKFKDRLNDKVSQEVALFNVALRQEYKQIEGKIAQLNDALAQTEYDPGTFMKLEPRPVQDSEIDDFRRSLRECLDESLENTDEANEARFLRIQKLVERLADKEKTRWREKVIDVRNWFNFAAREIEKESGNTRSFYEDSSGQSGGEKKKLAFTILVAAIAYQYDLDPSGKTPGRFHFVVVDEMFSNIDDQNAQYALKLFEQFGLQLLIVAPLDAKARVTEPFVDSYLHVVKDDKTNRSQMYSMTARDYEEIVKGFSGNGKPVRRRRATAKIVSDVLHDHTQ